MSSQLEKLIDMSFQLEIRAAELYRLFSETHNEDTDFWWELHTEELNHSHIIREAKGHFKRSGIFPTDMICNSVEHLEEDLSELEQTIDRCRKNPPARKEAFDIAIALEHTAAENNYNRYMKQDPNHSLSRVLHQLNQEDNAHAIRIRARQEEVCPSEK